MESVFAPFVVVLEVLLQTYHSWTGAWGISIILLSLTVSTVLLPLSILAGGLSRKELRAQQEMAPELAEIRRKYQGERQYREQMALYERHGYRPVMALRSSVGLMLQIPFFVAAFLFLREYPPLSGASLLFIDDLAKPDGALGGIHLLPILMTAVSAASSFVAAASQPQPARARAQHLIVALAFLVLLYGQPAGLVLYWTFNGIFALGQGIVMRFTTPGTPENGARLRR